MNKQTIIFKSGVHSVIARRLLIVICLGAFGLSVWKLAVMAVGSYEVRKDAEEARHMYYGAENAGTAALAVSAGQTDSAAFSSGKGQLAAESDSGTGRESVGMRSGEAGADRTATPGIADSVGAERAAEVPDMAERFGAGRAASSDIAGMLPAGASLPSQLQLPFPVIRDSFRGLLALNPDIVGWVKVGDTSIDYPVLQAADNEYYLHRSYKREESDAGSIFMDFRNKPLEAERNTILYGHRMKNGTMFGDLKKYMERDFFEKHRTFRYDTLSASYDVDIFSVYTTTADVNYIETEFADAAEFTLFLQQIRERSLYKTDMEHGAGDRIITLSTCDYTLDPKAGRLVVHGKLTRR